MENLLSIKMTQKVLSDFIENVSRKKNTKKKKLKLIQ